MSIKDCDRKARKNYKKKIIRLTVELYPTDTEIIDRLSERQASGEAKATYIKRLIREDRASERERTIAKWTNKGGE